jgi:hypothetical protein
MPELTPASDSIGGENKKNTTTHLPFIVEILHL